MARGTAPRGAARRRSAGLVPVVLGTGVLVVVGFGAGLLLGALWEAPERVLAPFRDGHQPVPLAGALADPTGTTAEPEPLPALAEPAEGAVLAGSDAAEEPGDPTRALAGADPAVEGAELEVPELPPVAAAPEPEGPWSVQVASFPEPVPAWKLAEQLGEQDYEVHVEEGDAAGAARWRVRVGPVATNEEARRLSSRLSAAGLETWIVDEGEGR